MAGLEKLDREGRNAVVRVLAPAEPIVFVTKPNPDAAARATWPTAAAGVFLAVLAAPIAFLAVDAVRGALAYGDIAWLALIFALIAVPAFLMGLWLAASPWLAIRRARDTVVLVTDRRLVTLSIARGAPLSEFAAGSILAVERTAVERGFGTLAVRHEAVGDEAETILTGLDDVLEAEFAIRRLALEKSITVIDPVE